MHSTYLKEIWMGHQNKNGVLYEQVGGKMNKNNLFLVSMGEINVRI